MKLIAAFICVFLLNAPLAICQNSTVQNFEIRAEDGLPVDGIISGFQCSKGFIWFAPSHGGLCRYDGNVVKTYSSEENGIVGNANYKAMEAPDGIIWVVASLLGGSVKKVSLFDPRKEMAVSITDHFSGKLPFKEKEITDIIKNGDGTIWIMTSLDHVYEYDGTSLQFWGSDLNGKKQNIFKVSDSVVCVLRKLTPNNIIYRHRSGEILDTQVLSNIDESYFLNCSKKDKYGNTVLFVEGIEQNLSKKYLLRTSINQPIQYIDSTKNTILRGYKSNGSFIYKRLKKSVIVHDLNLNPIFSFTKSESAEILFGDNQNGVWLVNGRGVLQRYYSTRSLFTHYDCFLKNMTWYTASRGITEGINNDLFIAQGGSIVHHTEGGVCSFLALPNQEKVLPDYFGCFLQKDKSVIWLTEGSRLWKLDPKSLVFENQYTGSERNLFWQPYEDKEDVIWIGSSKGLYFLNQQNEQLEKFEQYNGYDELKNCSVFAFYENSRGMWLSTSQGVFLIDTRKGVVAQYHTAGKGKYHLPHNIIVHLQEDKDGTFWLASKGGGLIHWNLNTQKKTQFTTKDGLKDNVLYACYPDDFGQVWLSSNNGLMRFDKKTEKIIHYTEIHGIPHLEFNTISHYKDKSGRLYFGGLKGTISFYPKDFVPKKPNHRIEITGFQKQNYDDEVYVNSSIELLKTNKIIIRPEDKIITLSFALLNYEAPKSHSYQYKIEGYDRQWQLLKSPRIQISGLPYGTYTLRIRAQSSGNEWQEFEAPLAIEVVRPFYLQWWFLVLAFILIFVGAAVLVKWRTSSLVKRKNELENIVAERTSEISKQAEELKTLDKMKSQFFANISHELRTPVTLILGPLEEMNSRPLEMQDQKQLGKNLNLIDRNARKLLVLIEEVLELSKLNAGKIPLEEESTILWEYIRQIKSSFESTADLKGIHYRLIYEPSKKTKLSMDKGKIEKTLNNLLSNAFKFTPTGGEIILKVTESQASILIAIKDNGIGIDAEDLPYVFDRFYQSKFPTYSAHGGTGIGLAICYEMAKLMDGKVWAESIVGMGSQFFFEFPKKTISTDPKEIEKVVSDEKQLKVDPPSISSSNTKTILLVEDNNDMREFVSSLLKKDYNILTAENGLEGIKALEESGRDIDLVISDVMMPILDGFSMLEQIKAHDDWRSLPVMMLTARAAEEDKLHALTIGVDDYLIKPFSKNELIIRIQNLLANYESRKLWKQDVLAAVKVIKEPKNQEEEKSLDDREEPIISQRDLLWMKEVEKKVKSGFMDENFNIDILAQQLNLSKRQFERKIKQITGLTPARIVVEVRLLKSREYLEQGRFNSISEVSYAVGIQTPNYFSRIYFKRFGKKPRDYFY